MRLPHSINTSFRTVTDNGECSEAANSTSSSSGGDSHHLNFSLLFGPSSNPHDVVIGVKGNYLVNVDVPLRITGIVADPQAASDELEKRPSRMVYRSVDPKSGKLGDQVYKIPIELPFSEVPNYLAPSRCVNRWNQNVCDEIIKYIVNEYKQTGRILVNAYLPSNFGQPIAPAMLRPQNILENLNLSDDQSDHQDDDQEIVCINTQFALNLHPDPARASVDSLTYWKEEEDNYKRVFLSLPSVGESYKVMQVITTLLIINKYFPDVNLDFGKEKCNSTLANYAARVS